jgi:C-terminal binding protein
MDQKYKVVITDFVADNLATEKSILTESAEVVALDAHDEQELEGKIEDADAIILYHSLSLTRKSLDLLRKCKLIVRGGVGIDNIDHGYARTLGIPVANIPDYGSEDVADTAIGMVLALARGITFLNSRLREGLGEWIYTQVKPLKRLRNSSIGIVGLGRIGTAAALRAKALGMKVIFYDPYIPDGFDKALGILRAETLQGLLAQVNIVSLHCPLNAGNYHMINETTLNWLSEGSYLINTARGGLVDTAAVADAIATGRLAGAAFDVLEQEPPISESLVQAWRDPSNPSYHRVLINPHAAFYTEEGLQEIRVKSAHACLCSLRGQEIRNVVN